MIAQIKQSQSQNKAGEIASEANSEYNSKYRNKAVKVIIQTLYSLGYNASAQTLQKQSQISYLTQQQKHIKTLLNEQKYENLKIVLQNRKGLNKTAKLNQRVRDTLVYLECMKIIRQGRIDDALEYIKNKIQDKNKQAELAEELMMGNGFIEPHELAKKHDFIVDMCFDQSISSNSMIKMLHFYDQVEQKGLDSSLPQQMGFKMKKYPPKRIVQVIKQNNIQNITNIKFNRSEDKLLTISSNKSKIKYISVWNVNKANGNPLTMKSHMCCFLLDDVIDTNWNYPSMGEKQKIVFVSFNYIIIIDEDLKRLEQKKLSTGHQHNNKILCANWNKLNNFIYVGGTFEEIKVYNQKLMLLKAIPLFRTRILQFSEDGMMFYAVSATQGKFKKFNIVENQKQSEFVTQECISSFKLANQGQNAVIVTEKQILYIGIQSYQQGNGKYTILNRFTNLNSQNNLIQIQAIQFDEWIITMNKKQFQAYSIGKTQTIMDSAQNISKEQREGGKLVQNCQRWNNKNSFIFDASQQYVISGAKQLIVWAKGQTLEKDVQMQYKVQEIQDVVSIISSKQQDKGLNIRAEVPAQVYNISDQAFDSQPQQQIEQQQQSDISEQSRMIEGYYNELEDELQQQNNQINQFQDQNQNQDENQNQNQSQSQSQSQIESSSISEEQDSIFAILGMDYDHNSSDDHQAL